MTLRLFYIVCFVCVVSAARSVAQEIDNTYSFRNISSNSYIRLSGDDDLFMHTDDQYTEGLNLEMCAPWLKKNPLSKLLLHPSLDNKSVVYGINIEQEDYTPTKLRKKTIIYGDRPYAATLFLNTFMIVTDYEREERFATVLSTGIIGPDAMGGALQTSAHELLNDIIPRGWKYQIRDDVILNYEWNYQRQFVSIDHSCSLDADAMARVGTLNDRVCPGITIMSGKFNSPFSGQQLHKKYLFYFFEHPEVDFVGYDAALQGGVFDNSSPYTLTANEISRIVFKNFTGITITNKRFTFQYYHCYQTRQYVTGHEHSWDGIQLTTAFR